LAIVGEIHGDVMDNYDIASRYIVAQLNFDKMIENLIWIGAIGLYLNILV